MHISPNISKNKGYQTTAFVQLAKYNIRNIFLKNYAQYSGENSPRPFSENSKLSISMDQPFEVLCNLLLLNVQVEEYQAILKLRCWPHAFTSYKAF